MSASRSFRDDYLCCRPELQSLYPHATGPIPASDEALKAYFEPLIAQRNQHPVDRQALASVLEAQYSHLSASAVAAQQIALLRKETTYTVTTGQQPGLWGGPMYTPLKALTTVGLARRLKKVFPHLDFVPLFWIASEDHDWAEVNHTWLSFQQRAEYKAAVSGAVGRHTLTTEIARLTPESPLLASAYTPGTTFALAFQRLIHGLLGEEGLLVLDPDAAELKRAFVPTLLAEALQRPSIHQLNQQTQKLEACGYKAQIQARDINLFYLTDNARLRLLPAGADVVVEGTDIRFTPAQLTTEATEHPERFSPGVVLRPVYQEQVLPNLAYIGGWAEVAYWGQLTTVFSAHKTPYPALFARMQAQLIPTTDWLLWQNAGFDWPHLAMPTHQLRRQLVERNWNAAEATVQLELADKALAALEALAAGIDAGQGRNVAGQRKKMETFRERLLAKLIKRQAANHPEWVAPLKVKLRWAAEGAVQERVLNWAAFAPQHPQQLMQWLLQNANTTGSGMQNLIVPSFD